MPDKPAKFLLKNSKGHPDFVMTMLVAVILCMFVVLLYWMMLNLIGLHLLTDLNARPEAQKSIGSMLSNFNQNSQIIILGICSSVFSLAGTYYLRRASYDKHYIERKKIEEGSNVSDSGNNGNISVNAGLEGMGDSSVGHPNFDDEEEDI